MTGGNVQSSQGVTLVGAGHTHARDIGYLLEHAPVLVAADGGANLCHDHGFSPVAVIGDFDSLRDDTGLALNNTRFLHIEEQDSTDFEKSLTHIEAPFVLATGFTGGRIDHTLAVLSTLAQHDGSPVVLLAEKDIVFAAPRALSLRLEAGMRLSLFPMSRLAGQSTGLKWPIDGLDLGPDARVSTSNETTGAVSLRFNTTGCLVILPREALSVALSALCDPTVVPAE
jgi:thiamine pyrophosphokinase